MPLIQSETDEARSQNMAELRRSGYPGNQASAIAFANQRKLKKQKRRAEREKARKG